ncbi:hypothetical protein GRX03_08670 [Halovenus sp. WSH3]|uniref:Uncharacterized protein n=1 Tax=Halovenus carboxidivorans TaxID=2692199 RepID=A0A6B0T176_9EURY|nr:hypothetical protein [Halovenus carboxidivorans]MXR51675.1 hypothetical protein [Halovenus carboxidivorans]
MTDGYLARLKRALQSAFLTHVPDHPANGGNTGDREWPESDESEPSQGDSSE